MKTSDMLLIGAAVLLLARSSPRAQARRAVANNLNNPTNWGADQWARLYGDDLAMAGGQHDAQSSLTPYGFTGSMGFQGSVVR